MNKKYHYVYLIESTFNGKYYIGIHSTDNLEDGYMGSGKRLTQDIERFGIDGYQKHILEFCDSRKELVKREEEIVTSDIINNWHCLNMVEGGVEKKKKYYVKGFDKAEWKKVKFEHMIKDGKIRLIINYLIPYHLELGWVKCNKTQINEYKENNTGFDENEDYCVVSKTTKNGYSHSPIKAKNLDWYLKRGWEIKVSVEDFKIESKRSEIRRKLINEYDGDYKELLENIEELIDKELMK